MGAHNIVLKSVLKTYFPIESDSKGLSCERVESWAILGGRTQTCYIPYFPEFSSLKEDQPIILATSCQRRSEWPQVQNSFEFIS